MKIIFSPTKTQNFSEEEYFEYEKSMPYFQKVADDFFKKLYLYDRNELKSLYKVSDKIIEELFEAYHCEKHALKPAIFTYTGITFQSLGLESWRKNDFLNANERFLILDAMYGVLKPSDLIEKYRLDMSHSKIRDNGTLKALWKEKYVEFFAEDEIIFNLASDEFSSLIPQEKLISFEFLDEKDGVYRVANTYVKMARGKFASEIIKGNIQEINELKAIKVDGYYFYEYNDDSQTLTYRRDEIK